jgi:hypothetical protein
LSARQHHPGDDRPGRHIADPVEEVADPVEGRHAKQLEQAKQERDRAQPECDAGEPAPHRRHPRQSPRRHWPAPGIGLAEHRQRCEDRLRHLQSRGADVSAESLSRRGARSLRLLPLVLAIGFAAIAVAGCGDSDKTDSISSEAQKRIEKGAEEGQKGLEKAKEEVKKGFNEAGEAAKKGVENGKGQTNKTLENVKKEAEEGVEKGKAETEKAIKEAERNYGN